MSYILDALKKSEEARRRQQAPDSSVLITEMRQSPRRASAGLWLAAALAINATLLGIWLWRTDDAEPDSSARRELPPPALPSTPGPEPTAPAEAAAVRPSTVTAAPPASARTAPRQQSNAEGPLATPEPAPAERPDAEPVPIEDLSTAQQRRVPTLAFSTHIYASDAAYREVGINGTRYREGDRLADDLLLETITETGVILRLDDTRFSVSVMQDWNY